MLSQNELLQYSRHIILPEIDVEGQERIKNSHILIVGMGGLGSPAAMYLAAAGVGHITIVDNDKVERSNLQRQIIHKVNSLQQSKVESAKSTLQSLNPLTIVHAIQQQATEESLLELIKSSTFDAVLDCSDNFETRFAVNRCSVISQIPLISATAVGFDGQLGVFNQQPDSACYHCLYSSMGLPEGDCEDQGILSPVVGTMGALQATETLKVVTNLCKTTNSFLLKYSSLKTEFKSFAIKKDLSCEVCGN